MSGFVGDFVGAGGCDGGGNALAAGVRTMFKDGRMGHLGGAPPDMVAHEGVDELADCDAMGPSGWHEDYFAMQREMPHPDMAAEFFANQEREAHMMMQQQQQAQLQQQPAAPQEDWASELLRAQTGNETAETWAEQHVAQQEDSWVEEYAEGVQTFGIEGEEAIDFDTKTSGCGFFKYLDKVKSGEIVLEEKAPAQQQQGAGWDEEYQQVEEQQRMQEIAASQMYADPYSAHGEWAAQYQQAVPEQAGAGPVQEDAAQPEFAEGDNWNVEFQKELQKMRSQMPQAPYVFEEDNPYMYHDNPFQEGLELLEAAMLREAALAFEAACQKEPDNSKAWQYLGTTQAENEKDVQSIAALQQCRTLDPENREVLMALSVSLTNETKFAEAIDTLSEWLLTHPEYQQHKEELQAVQDKEVGMTQEYFFLMAQNHGKVAAMFERAQELVENPDVCIGLGVLYNMSNAYRKAVTYFEKALLVKQDDAKLWNKLGASLANGNQCNEALKAYNKALDLNPGFVRALYNSAISYSNLGEHFLAAQFFLKGIQMQTGGQSGTSSTVGMWDSLRVTFSLLGRKDLVAKSTSMDVSLFRDEFSLD
eukprot:TRINITY_DN2612_c0_g1_i1.p1 TRINITY_DN2612_c0_g1~~TRINITY_DN2612_c0_g1_i1.p1  ORF type:complete len:591 (+),score=270.65 TRINITY_DN2612_c0_g1_i1:86-1858(+)